MNVRFIASMPKSGFHGGRLMALSYAESLSTIPNVNVDFLCTNESIMISEFKPFSKVKFIIDDASCFAKYIDLSIDIIIIVPHLNDDFLLYTMMEHAFSLRAKIVFLNFETPNWVNKLIPNYKDPNLWNMWRLISKYSDMILSISKESSIYAIEYYKDIATSALFDHTYVGVNNHIADIAQAGHVNDEILMISRVDKHKGLHALKSIAHPSLSGLTFRIVLGNGSLSRAVLNSLRVAYKRCNINLIVSKPISTYEKFIRLKSSKLLFFPTQFEGFGIPPYEAAYSGCPVACSNLPVLKEFGHNNFNYFDSNSPKSIVNCINTIIETENLHTRKKRSIFYKSLASLENSGLALYNCLLKL